MANWVAVQMSGAGNQATYVNVDQITYLVPSEPGCRVFFPGTPDNSISITVSADDFIVTVGGTPGTDAPPP